MRNLRKSVILPAFLLFALMPFAAYQQGFRIKPGTKVVFSGSPCLVIKGGHFTNDGTYTKSGETVKFTGSGSAQKIQGASTTVFSNLSIGPGAVVQLPPGRSATVNGTLTNNAGVSGLVIQSDPTGTGSLISGTPGVSGTMQRYIAQRLNTSRGWHFLSSPVASQPIQTEFVPNPPGNGQAFFSWDEPQGLWINTKDAQGNWASGFEANFVQGKGYLVNYASDVTKNFTGAMNVSDITRSGLTRSQNAYAGWHLLGNPFTCAVIWNTGWTMSDIASIAKVWNEAGSSYTDISPGGIIPAIQGFMVNVTTGTGSVTIPASARTHSSQPWYKAGGDPYIMLAARDPGGETFQESVVTFNAGATEGYDPEYDSRFLAGYAPLFFSVAGAEQLSTNALPALNENVTIPFSFIKNDGNIFSIEAVKIENVPAHVYLADLKAGTTQDLAENRTYHFTSLEEDDPARFLLSFGPVEVEKHAKEILNIYATGNVLCISNPGESLVEVYNMIGQKLQSARTCNETVFRLKLNAATGCYIVRVMAGNQVFTKKIVIN